MTLSTLQSPSTIEDVTYVVIADGVFLSYCVVYSSASMSTEAHAAPVPNILVQKVRTRFQPGVTAAENTSGETRDDPPSSELPRHIATSPRPRYVLAKTVSHLLLTTVSEMATTLVVTRHEHTIRGLKDKTVWFSSQGNDFLVTPDLHSI